MKRVVLAVLGVILAVAIIVVIARESSDARSTEKPAPVPSSVVPEAGADGADPDDAELEVKELSFGDGSANQRSIRIEHPSIEMGKRLRDWLEPREAAAVAGATALDCHAQLARVSLVSVVCVSIPRTDGDAGGLDAGGLEAGVLEAGADAEATDAEAKGAGDAGDPGARWEAVTLQMVNGDVKELALADVLEADAGEMNVIAACKKAADPPLPCVWPPTTFAVGPDGSLLICRDSHCVDIDGEAHLLRPELR